MKHTALLADDSLTIQKVIKITLGHEDFELTICPTDEQLIQKAEEIRPNLVFLDFSLSDSKSGYDLCSEVLKLSPNSKVLMLYGTFDTVDESALRLCRASDKIVKPFDSVKFVSLCKSLVSDQVSETSNHPEQVSLDEQLETDDWTVDEDSIVSADEKKSLSLEQARGEMNEWANSGIVLDHNEADLENMGAIPPVIACVEVSNEEDSTLPSNDDLEYPDMSSPAPAPSPSSGSGPSLQLQSMDELFIDDDDQPISLEEVIGTNSEEEVRKIEEEIADEISDDDLWSADEHSKNPEDDFSLKDMKERISSNLKAPEKVLNIQPEPIVAIAPKEVAPQEINIEQIVDQVMIRLKSELDRRLSEMVADLVEKNCHSKVETIAWEVIPDLAENLIKTEIKRISESVIDE